MPAWPAPDIEALLAPVPGENPAGGAIPFDLRQRLEEARKEVDPADFAADDPARPEEARRADWPAIARLAEDGLAGVSKDLNLAARLTEALVKLNGFAGLCDGLRLLRLLADRCWDRLHPPIEEEEDLEVRAAPLQWLDDPDRGARFPGTLRAVPLIDGEGGGYSWLDWRQSQGGKGRVNREGFEKAVGATPGDRCRQAVADILAGLDELNQLTLVLNARMGAAAPGMIGVRQALDDCRVLGQQILQRKDPAPAIVEAPAEDRPDDEAPRRAAPGPAGAPTREQVYRQLAEAADLLRRLEPHSPIPYLLQRAVELGAMPFPLLIKELVRNADVLSEMNRELGIKEPALEGDEPA